MTCSHHCLPRCYSPHLGGRTSPSDGQSPRIKDFHAPSLIPTVALGESVFPAVKHSPPGGKPRACVCGPETGTWPLGKEEGAATLLWPARSAQGPAAEGWAPTERCPCLLLGAGRAGACHRMLVTWAERFTKHWEAVTEVWFPVFYGAVSFCVSWPSRL